MKKITLFTIAAMLVAFSANAQEKLTYGIKGGFNSSIITNLDVDYGFDGYIQAERIPSFHAGAFAEWRFNRFFAVASELLYSRQGVGIDSYTRISSNESIYVDSYTYLNYLNIPVMAKFYPVKWLSIDLGPQAGLLISAKTKSTLTSVSATGAETHKETTNSKSDMKTLDFGFVTGLTFNFGKHVFLQTRYNFGLTEVFKSKSDMVDLNDKKHSNRVIQFGLGYRF